MNTESDIQPVARSYPVKVLRVIDGDTLEVSVSLGFHADFRCTLPLKGINCPEMHGPDAEKGKAAKAYVEQIVEKRGPWMMARVWKPDSFGRWLAELEIPGTNGLTLNSDLLTTAHAVPFMTEKNEQPYLGH